jgi:hypothetical protein
MRDFHLGKTIRTVVYQMQKVELAAGELDLKLMIICGMRLRKCSCRQHLECSIEVTQTAAAERMDES